MQQCLHSQAFRRWLDRADEPEHAPPQEAAQELLAEHHMMTCVLIGLEHEAGKLITGSELRPDFWRDAIDFIGNFVHQCHRVKEEEHFFPAAERLQLIDPAFAKGLGREHANAKELTLSICAGYQEGDWERVMRVVSLYAYLLRPHMEREERSLVDPVLETTDRATLDALTQSFRDVEAKALQGRSRKHYVEVARRLCAGLPIARQLQG